MKTKKYDNSKLVAFVELTGPQKDQAAIMCPKPQGNEVWRVDKTTGKVLGYRLK